MAAREETLLRVAFCARDGASDVLLTPFRSCYPGPQFPWRAMAHMLRVATRKVRDPVTGFILMKCNNR